VLEGEHTQASQNKKIAVFYFSDLPPYALGVPQINVTFKVDSNGILSVSAHDKRTNKMLSLLKTE
jgi:molecular chaperone DnaK